MGVTLISKGRQRKESYMPMKKIGCILLAVLLILPIVTFFASAEQPTVVMESENAVGEAGETLTVALRLNNNPGVTSIKLSLSYDQNVITLTKAEKTGLFDGWYQASPTLNTQPYLMVWVASEIQRGKGELVTLEFKIADSVAIGTVTTPRVTVEEAYCNGTELSAVPLEFEIKVECKHTYGAYTFVDDKTHVRECSKCHEKDIGIHRWNNGEEIDPATHLEMGKTAFTCTDCGEKRTEDIPKTKAHEYGNFEKYDTAKHKCVCPCGETEYFDHSWNSGQITTPATEQEAGIKTFTCEDCGETRTEEIPKLGQSKGNDPSGGDDPSKPNALPIVIGAVAALGIAAAVVFIIRAKGKKPQGSPEPPSEKEKDNGMNTEENVGVGRETDAPTENTSDDDSDIPPTTDNKEE